MVQKNVLKQEVHWRKWLYSVTDYPGSVPGIWSETCLLFGIYSVKWWLRSPSDRNSASTSAGTSPVSGRLAATLLWLPGRWTAIWNPAKFQWTAGSQMRLGAAPSGTLSGRSWKSILCHVASGSRNRTQICWPYNLCPKIWPPEFRKSQENGRCIKTGSLLYHLRWQTDVSYSHWRSLYHPTAGSCRRKRFLESTTFQWILFPDDTCRFWDRINSSLPVSSHFYI